MSPRPFTLPLGAPAPDFHLKATDKKFYGIKDFKDHVALVIFFTCNHCPFVKNSDELTRKTVEKYQAKNVGFIAINSNSANSYPQDSYEKMCERMQEQHFPWLYLHDDSQQVALAYGALKTPHFFLFDENRHLLYTGRAVDFPKDPAKVTTNDLENALEDYFHQRPIKTPLTNPIGCNIKWEGKEKHWMPAEACDLV